MTVPLHTDSTVADRAFTRFCRDGDVDALGLTFDLTAPRLVLVAAHLAGSDHADDLVQTTFVEAIRSKDRFEPGRPVLPWLLTILTRRAANVRRSRGRERHDDATLDLLHDPAPGPVDVASERELHERLATALDSLEGPYREVLALRLVHGLRPVQIARALDRPLGTVHAQLHRGAERLRGLLPRSLAAFLWGEDLMGRAAAGDALAAVRAEVLGIARVPAAPPLVATVMVGGIEMKKFLSLAATVVATLALAMLVALRPWEPAAGAPPVADVAPRHADVAAGEVGQDVGVESGMRARVQVSPDAAPGGARSATIVGRVVAAESDAPIGGASVSVEAWSRRIGRTVPTSWEAPVPIWTEPDGTFELRVEQDDRVGVSITVEAAGRVPMVSSPDQLRDGARLDVGVVPLSPGVPVSIRVVDFEGEPLAGFPVQFDSVGGLRRAGDFRFKFEGVHGFTDRDGRIERVVAFGDWKVRLARTGGLRVEGPSVLGLGAAALPRQDITYRLVPLSTDRSLSGVVVDERGRPVAGDVDVAMIQGGAVRGAASNPIHRQGASTLRDGRFFVGPFDPARGDVRVERIGAGFLDSGIDFEIVSPRGPVPIGTSDLRVVVRPLPRASLTVTVVDARSGAPVESFRASVSPVARCDGRYEFGRLPGAGGVQLGEELDHPDGIVRWGSLRPGDYLVNIEPSDAALARAFAVPIELLPGADGELKLELSGWRTVVARVVDPAGEPIVGAGVELLQSASNTPIRAGTFALTAYDAFERGHSGTFLTVATDDAVTNADGVATLRAPPHVGAAALRVSSQSVSTAVLELPEHLPAESSAFEIVVARQAVIEGRLRPLDVVHAFGPDAGTRARAALYVNEDELLLDERLAIVAEDAKTGRQGGWARVDDGGRFRMGPMTPGDYVLRFDVKRSRMDGAQRGIGRVDGLRAGETRRVEFDLAAFAPATLRGVVLRDGVAFDQGRLELDMAGAVKTISIGSGGRFTAERCLPGSGLAFLRFVDPDGRDCVLVAESPLDVRAGETVDVTLRFVTRAAVVRVVDVGGEPVRGLLVRGQLADSARSVGVYRTDDDGCVSIASMPRGPVIVRGRTSVGDDFELGRIQVPDSAREGRFELTWPH